MNNRYLYRAKRTDNGEWVEGNVVLSNDADEEYKSIIIPAVNSNMFTQDNGNEDLGFENWHKVDPSTICQYTGLTDKNGKKICENDIVRHEDLTNGRYIARKQPMKNSVIKWNCKEVKFERSDRRDIYKPESRLEVIGNIFDNPELLEVENGESR